MKKSILKIFLLLIANSVYCQNFSWSKLYTFPSKVDQIVFSSSGKAYVGGIGTYSIYSSTNLKDWNKEIQLKEINGFLIKDFTCSNNQICILCDTGLVMDGNIKPNTSSYTYNPVGYWNKFKSNSIEPIGENLVIGFTNEHSKVILVNYNSNTNHFDTLAPIYSIENSDLNYCTSNEKGIYIGNSNYKGAIYYDFKLSVWKRINNGGIFNEAKLNGDTLISFAGKSYDSIYISFDRGKTGIFRPWSNNNGWHDKDIELLNNQIFVSTNHGIYYSNNWAGSWNKILADTTIVDLAIYAEDVYALTKGGSLLKMKSEGPQTQIQEKLYSGNELYYADNVLKNSSNDAYSLYIYNIEGKLIQYSTINPWSNLTCDHLPTGIFLIKAFSKTGRIRTLKINVW